MDMGGSKLMVYPLERDTHRGDYFWSCRVQTDCWDATLGRGG
jgi:hypothetical protein